MDALGGIRTMNTRRRGAGVDKHVTGAAIAAAKAKKKLCGRETRPTIDPPAGKLTIPGFVPCCFSVAVIM